MNRPSTRALIAFAATSAVIFILQPDMFYDKIKGQMLPACQEQEQDIREVEGLGKNLRLCTEFPWYLASATVSGLTLLFS